MSTYDNLKSVLGNRFQLKIKNNTWAYNCVDEFGRNFIQVELHKHPIIRAYPDGETAITLAGWATPTTRDRLNRYTEFGVFQHKHEQYVSMGDHSHSEPLPIYGWFSNKKGLI